MRLQWAAFAELDGAAVYALLALRSRVFVVEQACVFHDPDGLDVAAWHLLAWDEGVLAGALRVLPRGLAWADAAAIGRVVVASTHRRQGLGERLMVEGLHHLARVAGPGRVRLAAQSQLGDWYGRLGFQLAGPAFDEDGIAHLPMVGELHVDGRIRADRA